MTAGRPAILVVGFPFEAELIRQALSGVPMTGHAMMPEGVPPEFERSGILSQRRFGEWIIGGRGRRVLRLDGQEGKPCQAAERNGEEKRDDDRSGVHDLLGCTRVVYAN